MKDPLERSTWTFLLLFLVFDLIAAHCYGLYLDDVLSSRFFRLGRDRGFFEIIEYLKFGLIIYVFHRCYQASVSPIARAWTFLFSIMLLDNAAGLHEAGGKLLAKLFSLPSFFLERPADLGEILMLALMEGLALLYVLWSCYRGREDPYLRCSMILFFLVGILGALSVITDALHLGAEEPLEILGMTILALFVHRFFKPQIGQGE